MKRWFLLLCIIAFFTNRSLAQSSIKLSVHAGSGISWFGGDGAASTTTYVPPDAGPFGYVINPFGSHSKGIFVAGVKASLHNKTNWIFSLHTQYEHTGAEVDITKAQFRLGIVDTSGVYERTFDLLSVNPQAGYIVCKKKWLLSVHAGADYAFHLSGQEETRFRDANGVAHITGGSGMNGNNDFRITAGLGISYKKLGLDVSYKHGLSNYWKASSTAVYSRMLQARLSYTIFQSGK